MLSHPVRLRCVLMPLDQPEQCVFDLTAVIGAPRPSVSRHPGQLRAAGLVADLREGRWIHYRPDGGLPEWVMSVLEATAQAVLDTAPYQGDREAGVAMVAHGDIRRCR